MFPDETENVKKCEKFVTKKELSNGHCGSTELVNGNISSESCNGEDDEDEDEDGEAVEKGEVEANEKTENDKKDEPEVVFIQDMGFTVKIVSPGTESFDIQVSIC